MMLYIKYKKLLKILSKILSKIFSIFNFKNLIYFFNLNKYIYKYINN